VRFTRWALRPDSGGPGTFRGGLGATYEIELLEEQAEVFLFGERGRFPPQGVAGGGPGALNVFTHPGPDGPAHPPMASKMVGLKIARGDRLRLDTPGGGGWGPPDRRDPAAVARDVAAGYVGAEAARRDYRVVLKPDGSVDRTETQRLREGWA
jgi:N-methylhydantoinase B